MLRILGLIPVLHILLALAGGAAGLQAVPPSQDEDTLKQAGLAVDADSLVRFFADRTLSSEQHRAIADLIGRLGADSFEMREEATDALAALGIRAVGPLRQAISRSDADIEVVRRAERVLEAIKPPGNDVTAAAVRLLVHTSPARAAPILLAWLPFADDDGVNDEARNALAILAGQHEAGLLAALADPVAIRRGAAAEALIRADRSHHFPQVRKLLHDPDPGVRLRTALALVEKKDKQAIPVLIALLTELPADELWPAEEVLARLAGDKAPQPATSLDAVGRKKAREDWESWWTKAAPHIDLTRLDQAPRLLGCTLIVQIDPGTGAGKVLEMDSARRVRWEIPGLAYPVDAQVIRHDRVLIAEYNGQRVSERNFRGDVLWEKRVHSPIGVQRLPGGTTFIACHNQLLIVDRTGRELFTYQRSTYDIAAAVPLREGGFFVVTNAGAGIRLDRTGKEIQSFATGHVPQFAGIDALADGKILLPQLAGGKVAELDSAGKVTWSTGFPQPTAATRLPNGNTLVTSFQSRRVVELNSRGEILHELRTEGQPFKARKR